MSPLHVKPLLVSLLTLLALSLSVSPLTARGGLDSYEIYLNGKLLLRQVPAQSLSLKSLSLNASNANDKLVIYYSQCNAPVRTVKGRSITVRDGNGKILQEWRFADMGDGDGGMTIPVKAILSLAKAHTGEALNFYYASESRPGGQALATIHASEKTTAAVWGGPATKIGPATKFYSRRHGIAA